MPAGATQVRKIEGMSMRRFSALLPAFFSFRTLALAAILPVLASLASATNALESLTGYNVAPFQAAPQDESLVSFDWDSMGALYYMTGDPNWGFKLNVYRNVSGAETAIYQSAAVWAGSRITTVGPFVYFNDGGDYVRSTANCYAYDAVHGGAPALSYDSSQQPLSLWGLDTRDGSQCLASGAVGFGPSSIYYMSAPSDGQLNSLASLGEIGESSGPVAFDAAGNLFYAHGYSFSGQAKIYRWTAAELAAAIANPVLTPLSPVNHEWAVLPATFTGAGGMAVDGAANVYVTANAGYAGGELLLYRPAAPGALSVPTSLARCANRLETLRLHGGMIYLNCAEGIFRMPVPLSVSLAGDGQVHAVAGKPLTLAVETSGGEGTVSYAWFLTGSGKTDLPLGNDSPTLTVLPALGDTGNGYYCAVTDAGMTVTSPIYTLEAVVQLPAASFILLALMAVAVSLIGMAVLTRRSA